VQRQPAAPGMGRPVVRWGGEDADGDVRPEVPIVVVCAKLTGLYDRDETLLGKTTLDEAPKRAG
jgi:hypothetical protein